MADDPGRLRRTLEANLADAKAALNLLPERSLLRDYVDNIRFNCEAALRYSDGLEDAGQWGLFS